MKSTSESNNCKCKELLPAGLQNGTSMFTFHSSTNVPLLLIRNVENFKIFNFKIGELKILWEGERGEVAHF